MNTVQRFVKLKLKNNRKLEIIQSGKRTENRKHASVAHFYDIFLHLDILKIQHLSTTEETKATAGRRKDPERLGLNGREKKLHPAKETEGEVKQLAGNVLWK